MAGTYSIDVTEYSDGGTSSRDLVSARGSLGLIAYAEREVREALKGVKGEVTAEVNETDGVGGESLRTVVQLNSDADTVALVLKSKLATERKRSAESAVNKAAFGGDPDPESGVV